MPYNPNLYNPYGSQQVQPTISYPQANYQPTVPQMQPIQQGYQQQAQSAAPVTYIVPVNSLVEAKEYREQPGSEPPLFALSNDNVILKKEVDEQGGEKFVAFRLNEIPLSEIMPKEGSYVTKEDFDAFANKVMEALNGKPVAQPTATADTSAAAAAQLASPTGAENPATGAV